MNDAGDPSSVPGPSMPNSAIPPQPNTPPPFRRAVSEDYQRHEQSFEVGYVYSEEMLLHASIHGHPEAPERISVIKHELEETRLLKKMIQIPIRHAKRSEVLLVHSADLWDKVEAIQCMSLKISPWLLLKLSASHDCWRYWAIREFLWWSLPLCKPWNYK